MPGPRYRPSRAKGGSAPKVKPGPPGGGSRFAELAALTGLAPEHAEMPCKRKRPRTLGGNPRVLKAKLQKCSGSDWSGTSDTSG